jgi:hypothetical protein
MTQPQLQASSPGAGAEQRTQKRYRCPKHLVVRYAIKPTFRNYPALVHDISVNGIGFLVDGPLEQGTTLALQLRGGSPGTSLIRTARVMHVRRHLPVADAPWVKKKPFLKALVSMFLLDENGERLPGYIYLVGCRFSPALTPEELHALCGSE